ncbi:hypothetical protein JTY60_02470 [symbiont of Argiope bruennichi]|uniref:hypothetical protein n=1 Tax=symbiont of Argiope bruennichi TaxID=2810479 RepID=UPI003DA645F8
MIRHNKENQIKIIAFCGIYGAFILLCLAFLKIQAIGNEGGYLQFADAFLFLGCLITTSYIYVISMSFVYVVGDLLNNAAIYAPITFFIKLISLFLMTFHQRKFFWYFIFLCISQALVLFGYFFYEIALYGISFAISSLYWNFLQVISAISIGSLLGYLLLKSNLTLIDDIWIK